MPGVFHDEENSDLEGHFGQRGEGHTRVHTEVFAHGVKEPDLRKLNSEVGEEDHLSATPLFFSSRNFILRDLLVGHHSDKHMGRELYLLNLVFPEVGYGINYDPR